MSGRVRFRLGVYLTGILSGCLLSVASRAEVELSFVDTQLATRATTSGVGIERFDSSAVEQFPGLLSVAAQLQSSSGDPEQKASASGEGMINCDYVATPELISASGFVAASASATDTIGQDDSVPFIQVSSFGQSSGFSTARVVVFDRPATLALSASVSPFSTPTNGDFRTQFAFRIFGDDINTTIERDCATIGDGGATCGLGAIDEELTLQPGSYTIALEYTVNIRDGREPAVPESVSASLTANWSWTLGLEPEPCDTAWAAAQSGNFEDGENWDPPVAPDDDGEGCVNLSFAEAGEYEVTIPVGSAANSLSVTAGSPTFVGGTLALAGMGDEPGLEVLDAGRLSLGDGIFSSDEIQVGPTVAIGEDFAFLRIAGGASLNSSNGVHVARGLGSSAELTLGAGEEAAILNATGGLFIGGAGEARLLGVGPLTINVALGDTSLAVFETSNATVDLSGDASLGQLVDLDIADNLLVGLSGTAILSLAGNATLSAGALELGSTATGNGTFAAGGPIAILDVEGEVTIGNEGAGKILLDDGANMTTGNMSLGKAASGNGELELIGADTLLAVDGDINAGEAGTGSLTLRDGARLTADNLFLGTLSDTTGFLNLFGDDGMPPTLTVTGVLAAGSAGDAIVVLSEGAVLNVDGDLIFGPFEGSTSSAVLFGQEFTEEQPLPEFNRWNIGNELLVGRAGAGAVAVSDTALIETAAMRLGTDATGTGSYTASGLTAITNVADELAIAEAGNGTVTISDFSSLNAGTLVLGKELGGLGILRLFSGGAVNVRLAAGEEEVPQEKQLVPFGLLEIGRLSNGLIELFDLQTILTCEEAVLGGTNPAAGGTLSVDTGATFECANSVSLGAFEGPALFRVANGGVVNIGSSLIIGDNGLVIVGAGSRVTSSLVTNGRIEVRLEVTIARPAGQKADSTPKGPIAGPVVFDGDLTLNEGGVLEIDAGTSAMLEVTGMSTLAGTLQIALVPGQTYTDDSFTDLVAFSGGVDGAFQAVEFLNAPEGFEANATLEDGTLRLNIISAGQSGEGEGEGEGDPEPAPPSGCGGAKDFAKKSLKQFFGDLLILLLAAVPLLCASRYRF